MKLAITGGEVLIDDEDFEQVSRFKWHVNDMGYAVWRGILDGKKQTVRMHRLITACPPHLLVDHINHDRLDNRRDNLRCVTQVENQRNRTDQGKGYWYQRQNRNWVVEVNGKHVGSFATELEAARVANHVRSGGTYVKPARVVCRNGHSLEDAYNYNSGRRCRTCQSLASKSYYSRKLQKEKLRLSVEQNQALRRQPQL